MAALLSLVSRAPEDLYRRMVVVMFEDAILHPPALVLYVWLMMAHSKGYRAGRALQAAVLASVLEIGGGALHDWDTAAYTPLLETFRDDALLDLDSLDSTLPAEVGSASRAR